MMDFKSDRLLVFTCLYEVLSGLPHARGGVSYWQDKVTTQKLSSPCTWGCFYEVLDRKPL